MENPHTSVESIAPTIEEAIEKGLGELGVTRDSVRIEILDEGSKGLFGLGTRQARVRLVVQTPTPVMTDKITSETVFTPEIPSTYPENVSVNKVESKIPVPVVEADQSLLVASETVSELLRNMHINARVSARIGENEDKRGRPPILVDIHGDDLSILIGRRAETLNALQNIVHLMVSKELGFSATLVVDVEGYRDRREEQIRRLARRMADQAVKTDRRQLLEPMPANERRIVHMELRDFPGVRTESTGEEPHRKVNIIPSHS